jgi:hypothetical protein
VIASRSMPLPSRPLPKDNKAPFEYCFLHFTSKSKIKAMTAAPAIPPNTPPTTTEVGGGPEPEPLPLSETDVIDGGGIDAIGVPPTPIPPTIPPVVD